VREVLPEEDLAEWNEVVRQFVDGVTKAIPETVAVVEKQMALSDGEFFGSAVLDALSDYFIDAQRRVLAESTPVSDRKRDRRRSRERRRAPTRDEEMISLWLDLVCDGASRDSGLRDGLVVSFGADVVFNDDVGKTLWPRLCLPFRQAVTAAWPAAAPL
jgi:hypothetical protein